MNTLYIQVIEPCLLPLYRDAVNRMNTKEYKDNKHKDSGFDLFFPKEEYFEPGSTRLIDLGIKCAAYKVTDDEKEEIPMPFYLYPRSSIYKTTLRLANSVGIIDSGYRGNIKAAFDNFSAGGVCVETLARGVQICMPDLMPFEVKLVEQLDKTNRGDGGFGSTGV